MDVQKEHMTNLQPITKVFWAGRLSRDKNVQTLIRAITLCPTSFVLFIGGDGPARKPLEQLAQRLQVEDRVFFLGKLDEQQMNDMYEHCSVYCQPSLFLDACPRTVMEAMSHGKPAIVSDRTGYDNAPVTILPPLDYHAWARELLIFAGMKEWKALPQTEELVKASFNQSFKTRIKTVLLGKETGGVI
jgi:glycosyltransferase involved in cell wall biosynthesis